ncbi:unnamed protein product [Prorocentrum cordatum]|uniref:Uncharacterized protein n=1 Tax=Prorocentrum cordatum TaxID=2364126 RepID=A0ABN9YFU9_9DINO|nr:unnamed protein product [Polarella glacialis]
MAGGDMSQRGGAPAAAPRRAARAPWPGRAHLPLGRRRPNWRTLTRHNISSKAPRQNVTTCSLRARPKDMSFAQEWKPTPSELRGEDGSTPAGAATGPAAAAVRANVCRPRAAAPRARVALGRCVLPRGPEGRER